jgi:AraC-like DNA-binding protein
MATSGDPLADVVTLLQPAAPFSKLLTGAGGWAIRRTEFAQPFYCALLDGSSRLLADGHEPVTLQAGDFILIPSAQTFTATSLEPATSMFVDGPPIQLPNGEFRLGTPTGLPDVRMLIGYCTFGSPDAALLVSLLPKLVIVRGERRLTTLMQLVRDESRKMRPARDVILMRLLEVLLIEALRSTVGTEASPGLLRGLADARLVMALRKMHESPAAPWTVAQLSKEAGLSRSTFFERFSRAVGVAPMEYLLSWRMALAKNLLRRNEVSIGEIAERVGYSSQSTFTVAFTRLVGSPPTRFAREQVKPTWSVAHEIRDTGRALIHQTEH